VTGACLDGMAAMDCEPGHSSGLTGDEGAVRSAALGNCAAGHVQLVVPADPSLFPVPSASASSGI